MGGRGELGVTGRKNVGGGRREGGKWDSQGGGTGRNRKKSYCATIAKFGVMKWWVLSCKGLSSNTITTSIVTFYLASFYHQEILDLST